MSPTRPLRPRAEQFCHEYLVDGHGAHAYQRAGYRATGNAAESGACKLLRDSRVQARLAELQAARAARTSVDADYVVRRLQELETRAEAHKQFPAAVRAVELLGKLQGMFDDLITREKALALIESFALAVARHVDAATLDRIRREWAQLGDVPPPPTLVVVYESETPKGYLSAPATASH